MSHSYDRLYYHVVFATKYRRRVIDPSVESQVWSILWDTCVRLDLHPFAIGGVDDHIHIAVAIPKTVAVSTAVGQIKNLATREIRAKIPSFSTFSWQGGYSIFSVGYRHLPVVMRYIQRQRAHHSRP